jgi:hypothetical protein
VEFKAAHLLLQLLDLPVRIAQQFVCRCGTYLSLKVRPLLLRLSENGSLRSVMNHKFSR